MVDAHDDKTNIGDSQVLFLTYDGLTDPLGQSQILPYLGRLALKGYKISIVSFEKSCNAHLRSEIRTICDEHGIVWHPMIYHKRPSILSTVFDLWRAWRVTSSLLQKYRFGVVHCRSYLMAMIGLRMKNKYKVPFIFDMRGFWIEERLDGGLWTLNNPIGKVMYRFFKRQEQRFFQHADQIVCLTEKAAQIIAQLGAAGPITVIPCCVEKALFDPKKIDAGRRTQLLDRLRLKQRFVIMYLGSVGTWYMLDEMLDFFQVAQRKIPNAKFLIVSNDSALKISKIVKARGLDSQDVVVTKSRRCDVPLFLSLAHFSIFFIKPRFSKQGSSPTKLAESLSMSVPVIANAGIGDIDRLFSENNFGLLVHGFTKDEYQRTVDSMMKYQKAINLSGDAAQKFSLELGVASYERIYRSLLCNEEHKGTKFGS